MADLLVLRGAAVLRRISFPDRSHRHTRTLSEMSEPIPIPGREDEAVADAGGELPVGSPESFASSTPPNGRHTSASEGSPRLSRNNSFSGSSSYHEDWEAIPPLDRLSVFDLLDNLALPSQLEKLQRNLSAQTDKVLRQRNALRSRGNLAKDKVVEEWRRRVPTADEQLEKYRRRMKTSVDKLGKQWNDTKAVTLREKFSFIFGVLNILISGYLIGGRPEWFHIWYTLQLLYFMPIRFFTYKRRGLHYFLADLCYFVNFLCMLSIWVFPRSKRLFISTYCLAFGNNAIAIAMWRNSLVFHSLDKVTSLFIHIMPCVALHCMVHLLPDELQASRFPALHTIRTSAPSSPEHYTLAAMALWSTLPYAVWQLSYHFLITVRRRAQIAAGRPTSYTWLKKSYSKAWIGRAVTALPDSLQEPAFMFIQYSYALGTMLPCPIWFWYRWASSLFLFGVFTWSIYNGATYYIDVFGKRFQNELEEMRKEVQKWQSSPDLAIGTPPAEATKSPHSSADEGSANVDSIPLLSEERQTTGIDGGARDVARERKAGELSP
ncbi:hypothetical protein V502_11478 [Pseudogymnoascus sp. VKM F-4520 (FW-2644)]|nr:hypothetical protein V502_11478 [Pseudogymnoascus sp. VKM F-4520 (FW-2644)]